MQLTRVLFGPACGLMWACSPNRRSARTRSSSPTITLPSTLTKPSIGTGSQSGRLKGRISGPGMNRGEGRGPPRDRRDIAVAPVQVPVAERVLGLHHLVDLRRALVDDRRARVAEVALDPVLGREAVRAEHLDRHVRGLERRLRRVPLRKARLARRALALVLHPRGLHDEQLRRLVAEHHLRDHVLHELVAADLLPERLALARVLDGALEARAHDAARARRDGEAALVERVHRDLEALPLLADEVLRRHLDVLEEELPGRAGPDPELVLRVAGRDSLPLALDDERRDALVLRGGVGLREDELVVGH